MEKIILTIMSAGIFAALFSGCAQDNYDNRSNYDRHMDYKVQKDMDKASSQLSAQDIKNINNLK